MSPIAIEQVKKTVLDNLPECWPPLEACLSLVAAASLEDVGHCIGLILVGAPGGRKTTTIGLMGKGDQFVKLDSFTPASFVSHDASKTEADLKKIDLLPRITHKIMVIPELGPLFTQRYEDLTRDIGILTAVMDGKGYESASGVHGSRGYDGDHRFGMIAATTPMEHKVWQALGRLSSRWIFFRLEEARGQGFDLRDNFASKVETCEAVVNRFIKDTWPGYACIPWNRKGDLEVWTKMLQESAECITRWRGISLRQDGAGFNPNLIEVPYRLAETLYALARGHAMLWEEYQIGEEDVRFAIDVNNGNMPEDRARLFRAFMRKGFDRIHELFEAANKSGAELTMEQFKEASRQPIGVREAARAIGCAPDTAVHILEELEGLGVVIPKGDGYTWA